MSTLMRWDPFRELTTMRNLVDRMMDESIREGSSTWPSEGRVTPLALDLIEDEDAFTVKASLPGIDPDDVEITLSDNVLTLKGETKAEKDVEEKNYRLRERRFGSFARSVSLPVPIDSDNVEATHENGVLTLRLPKSEEVKPKKISVKKMIESSK